MGNLTYCEKDLKWMVEDIMNDVEVMTNMTIKASDLLNYDLDEDDSKLMMYGTRLYRKSRNLAVKMAETMDKALRELEEVRKNNEDMQQMLCEIKKELIDLKKN